MASLWEDQQRSLSSASCSRPRRSRASIASATRCGARVHRSSNCCASMRSIGRPPIRSASASSMNSAREHAHEDQRSAADNGGTRALLSRITRASRRPITDRRFSLAPRRQRTFFQTGRALPSTHSIGADTAEGQRGSKPFSRRFASLPAPTHRDIAAIGATHA